MKLIQKLTVYNTLSKLALVILFITLLPSLVDGVVNRYTNFSLKEQRKQVGDVIDQHGLDYYFQGDSTYGSYTMLKEEYISLVPATASLPSDTIETTDRIIEGDTLSYRVLIHAFPVHKRWYVLEIGRTLSSIHQYNRPLQRVALYALIALIVGTLVIDLIFTRRLLRPLGEIIRTRLLHRQFPFTTYTEPLRTSTTDFKYLDDSLLELMQQINTAFEKEREFTSNASHELMTPIGILQNKLENLMMEEELPESVQEKIHSMMQTLHRLTKIVRALLFISRIENDQYGKTDQVDMEQLVREVLGELEDRLEARRIRADVSLAGAPILPSMNRDLLYQLIFNLVNNAIRYNHEEGRISIHQRIEAGKDYRLFIEDNGIGIAEKDIGTIFHRFKRGSGLETEGYGLGLSIVNSIARYHDIHLDVKSVLGKGTVFGLKFPSNNSLP